MKINIESIPHEQHRYTTVGDWWFDEDGTLQVRTSKLSDKRYENLIILHELIEVLTCELDGVTAREVDNFDKNYEANRQEGDESEPGDASDAPYRKQHCMATGIERVLASIWGVDWLKYEKELCDLPEVKEKL